MNEAEAILQRLADLERMRRLLQEYLDKLKPPPPPTKH